MATNAYQMAALNTALTEGLINKDQNLKTSNVATSKQKQKMIEELEAQMKAAKDKARKKSKKFGGLGKLLDVAGMFMGPLGMGLTKGINALIQGKQQQKGAESLLDGINSKRFENTFLSNNMEEYKEEVEDSQLSINDILTSSLMSGIQSYATGQGMGAEKLGSGKFKEIFKKNKTSPLNDNIGFGKSKQFIKDSSPLGDVKMFGDKSANFDLLNKGNKVGGNFDVFGKDRLGFNPESLIEGKRTPFKNIFSLGKEKIKGLDLEDDNLQKLIASFISGGI